MEEGQPLNGESEFSLHSHLQPEKCLRELTKHVRLGMASHRCAGEHLAWLFESEWWGWGAGGTRTVALRTWNNHALAERRGTHREDIIFLSTADSQCHGLEPQRRAGLVFV